MNSNTTSVPSNGGGTCLEGPSPPIRVATTCKMNSTPMEQIRPASGSLRVGRNRKRSISNPIPITTTIASNSPTTRRRLSVSPGSTKCAISASQTGIE